MAQGQKYVQGCAKCAFLIGTFPEQNKSSDLQQFVPGAKKNKMAKKGTNWGQSDPLCWATLRQVRCSLTSFVHIWPSLRKLVHDCAHPRPRALFNSPSLSSSLPPHPFLSAQPKLRLGGSFVLHSRLSTQR